MHIKKYGVEKSGSGNFMVDMSKVEKFIIAMSVKKFLLWLSHSGCLDSKKILSTVDVPPGVSKNHI